MQTCVSSTGTIFGPWRVTVWSGLRFEICTFNKGIFDSSCTDSRNGDLRCSSLDLVRLEVSVVPETYFFEENGFEKG